MVLKVPRKPIKHWFWVIYLAIGLIYVQSANLHFDVLDHQHQPGEIAVADHDHPSALHVCALGCATHAAHDSSSETKVDITPPGILKNLVTGLLSIVLVFCTVTVFLICPSSQLLRRRNNHLIPLLRRSSRRPPLRAPPL